MNLLTAPLTAVLIGLFVRSKTVAAALFLSIQAIIFTFQSVLVLLAWMAGLGGFGGATDGAFGPAPTELPLVFSEPDLWLYGLVNLAIFGAGLALTLGIVTLRARRRAKHVTGEVGIAPAH